MDIKEFRELRQIGTNRNKAIAAEIDSGLSRINKLIKFAENTPEYRAELDRQFEEMKKRNKADHGTFYTLDNGSFNRGLRTYNRVLTSKDLRKYD